jgi:hypothetical protein
MFLNPFKKKQDNQEDDFVYDQAVILEIDLQGLDEFGTSEQHDEIDKLQHEIGQELPADSGIDGDEYGEGTCTIYIYGPSADSIFKSIEPILKKSLSYHTDVTLQYGRPEDEDAEEKKFSL